MKKFLALAVAVLLAFGASAQVQKGEMILGVNVGLGNIAYPAMKALPPITLEYEHGVYEGLFGIDGFCLGVGGILAYTQAKDVVDIAVEDVVELGSLGYRYSSVIAAAKGSFHYDFSDLEELDIYAAVSLGWDFVTARKIGNWPSDYEDRNVSASGLFYDVSIGARYWFTDFMAANLEAGYGLSWLKAGINFGF